jgi:phosphoglycerol transferase
MFYTLRPYINAYNSTYSDFIAENYVVPDKTEISPIDNKNCIVLILESMENSFMDEEINLQLANNLKLISEENLSFKDQIEIFGTGYTIGGLTGQFFGLPLRLPFDRNGYGGFSQFLPNATSIIDILDDNNYNINLIMGSSSKFSGLDNFYRSHSSNPKIYDSNYFLTNEENKKFYYENWWGFNDKFTYEKSKEIILDVASSKEKFFIMLMTIDTHNPIERFDYIPNVYGDDRDGFLAADQLANDFIEWLKCQSFYNDTVVIIMGDHLFMSGSLGPIILSSNGYKRTIYNAFLNTNKTYSDKRRLFSTVDLAPTILEAIGFNLPNRKFGLGVSLFSEQPTLVEEYGEQFLNRELTKRSLLYESFF